MGGRVSHTPLSQCRQQELGVWMVPLTQGRGAETEMTRDALLGSRKQRDFAGVIAL